MLSVLGAAERRAPAEDPTYEPSPYLKKKIRIGALSNAFHFFCSNLEDQSCCLRCVAAAAAAARQRNESPPPPDPEISFAATRTAADEDTEFDSALAAIWSARMMPTVATDGIKEASPSFPAHSGALQIKRES